MKWADAESMPDMEAGWPAYQIFRSDDASATTGHQVASTDGLNVAQLDKDLKSVLIEKAAGKVHTRVFNSASKGVCTRTLMCTGTSRKRQA